MNNSVVQQRGFTSKPRKQTPGFTHPKNPKTFGKRCNFLLQGSADDGVTTGNQLTSNPSNYR